MSINLLKLSLLISIIGILILIIVSLFYPLPTINLKNLSKDFENKKIRVTGEVTSIKNFNDFQLITIQQENKTLTILNNNPKNLTKNQKIIATGKITIYKNELELVSDKISLITLKSL